ncbi:Abi-alpha family protein [Bradyrhizobium centrosematis]|uniref:Abi-alpha family protein n=1 Tax=Bradyrhizobium centrosematis TaxID=1300039 RepID=UPI00388DF527
MSEERPDLPYEKAIEEAAKTLGKAVDVVKSASPAIDNIYGWMIGDRVSEARKRNADAFARKTKKIIEERNLKDARPLPEDLATPLLEQAQRESREEMQELYASLLANAMDPAYSSDVRPEFIQTLRNLQPIDILVLRKAMELRDTPNPTFHEPRLRDEMPGHRQSSLSISINHLEAQGCLRTHPQGYIVSAFGQELLIACDPHVAK